MKLALNHQTWKGAKNINGKEIADQSQDGYTVQIYLASTGRITIRCSYWHHEQDISREGYLLDHRVSAATLTLALDRAREAGYPRPALMAAISEAEENLSVA